MEGVHDFMWGGSHERSLLYAPCDSQTLLLSYNVFSRGVTSKKYQKQVFDPLNLPQNGVSNH